MDAGVEKSTWSPGQPWVFERTPWSRITGYDLVVGRQDSILEGICRRYWKPVFYSIRNRGSGEHDAQDLTQAFFAHLLSNGGLTKALDQRRGSLRGFFRQALKRFCINEWRRETAQKRGGQDHDLPLEDEEWGRMEMADVRSDPAAGFDRVWAESIMETALSVLGDEMKGGGKPGQFSRLRVLLFRPPVAGEYRELSSVLRMSESAVAMHVLRLRKRFREVVEELVAEGCGGVEEVRGEVGELIRILTGSRG